MDNTPENSDKSLAPIVAIDGAAIKRIREGKKLTQLYVANVVGVTTDTISRWENNRYPTIKRDNGEKLAQALEVEIEEILRKEELPLEDGAEPPTPEPAPRRRTGFYVGGALALLALLAAGFFAMRSGEPPRVTRWLPRHAAPGDTIPVQIRIDRGSSANRGLIVRERLPEGWQMVKSSPAAPSAMPAGNEVKWLVPGGAGQVTISYTVMLPRTARNDERADFVGSLVLSAASSPATRPIAGDGSLNVDGRHWADQNGDGRIDDNEIMPAYYLTEEMKGLGLDWKTIEQIWSAKSYAWNPRTQSFDIAR